MKAVKLEYVKSKLDQIQEMYPEALVSISPFKDGYGIGFTFSNLNEDTITEEIEGIPVLFVHYEC